MNLLDRVKELASVKSVSLAELERKLDFGNGSMRKWSTSTPSIDKIEKVADYFCVSTDYLLGRTNDPEIKKADEKLSSQYRAIQRKAKSLTVADQERLLQIMDLTFQDLLNGGGDDDDDL